MSLPDASTTVLRAGVLDGLRLLLAGGSADAEPGASIAAACAGAGARVAWCRPQGGADTEAQEQAMQAAVAAVLAELGGGVEMLVVDGAALLADGLTASLQIAWDVTRAVAQQAMLPAGSGRIVLLAPAPEGGEHAGSALAGLENLARTLSIEWARHRVTCVAIAPGAHTQPEQLAQLVAYLASPAGAYFSGCLLDLRGQPA